MASSNIVDMLEELYEGLYYGVGIANMGVAGVTLIVSVIAALVAAIFGFMVSLLVFVLEAIPLYKIAKKLNKKSAWLVWLGWLPVVGGYISTYVFADIPGDKPVKLTDKMIIQNRLMSFWIRCGIGLFGTSLITVFICIISFIPVLGQIIGAFSTMLYLVPAAAIAWIEYVYICDVLDIFNPNQRSNRNAAIVIAVLDSVVTFGLARAFYLYTVMNKEPLPNMRPM